MGPLKKISNLPNNFLVMNGDILTNLNFNNFYNDHVRDNELYTISSYVRTQKVDYGVIECNKDNYLINFKEKPKNNFNVSMGIYMLNKKVLESIPPGFFGFDSLMHKLIESKLKVKVKQFSGYWLDIGRPDDYMKAIEDFESMKNIFL